MCQTLYPLDAYGNVTTVQGAQDAFALALKEAIQCGGGIIEISADTHPDFKATQSYDHITIVDARGGLVRLQIPMTDEPVSGSGGYPEGSLLLRQTYQQLPEGLYGAHRCQAILRRNIHGGSSLRTELMDVHHTGVAVQAGQNAKWYPTSIEGIFVGQRFDVNDGSTIYTVTALGWDSAVHAPYFVADAPSDIRVGSLIANKTAYGTLEVISEDHCANQSAAEVISKYVYSDGDATGSQVSLYYQGNIMSAGGDEGGIGYAAEIIQDPRTFRGGVQSFDSTTGILTYSLNPSGPTNTERLATGRPLINLNAKKWITSGKVRIYISNTYQDEYKNTGLEPKPTNGVILGAGTSWGPELIGRYFAVDEPSEYLDPNEPGGFQFAPEARLRRWYRIMDFRIDPANNNQLLFVRIVMWGTGAGAPNLIDGNNYYNYNPKAELNYIIAPGAIVSDVRGGVNENDSNILQNTLVLQQNGDFGNPTYQFEKGDSIEQAIGPQPWNPTGFRVRHVNNFPSLAPSLPDYSFASYNWGTTAVSSGLAFVGESDIASAKAQYRHAGGVAYDTGIAFAAVTRVGIGFGADIQYVSPQTPFLGVDAPDAGLAIVFGQATGNRKVIAWTTRNPAIYATFGFRLNPDDPSLPPEKWTYAQNKGTYQLRGGQAVEVGNASLNLVKGVSATAKSAQNLRGINVPVQQEASTLSISFSTPEVDAAYAISITPSWPTTFAVKEKTPQGFQVLLGTPPSQSETLDWFLIR